MPREVAKEYWKCSGSGTACRTAERVVEGGKTNSSGSIIPEMWKSIRTRE